MKKDHGPYRHSQNNLGIGSGVGPLRPAGPKRRPPSFPTVHSPSIHPKKVEKGYFLRAQSMS